MEMRKRRQLKNEINVVPYIDVMLVLLVIFMVTAPMMQTSTIDLPTVGKSSQTPMQPMEVGIRSETGYTLTDRAGDNKERTVDRAELKAAILATQAIHPDQPVLIAGEKSVRYELVLQVMDELQQAQVKRVGLLVQPRAQ
jgi:biopolymer transport protein TolR